MRGKSDPQAVLFTAAVDLERGGGHQAVLNWMAERRRVRIDELPPEYNWVRLRGPNEDAVVRH